jgi:hypothetical protein
MEHIKLMKRGVLKQVLGQVYSYGYEVFSVPETHKGMKVFE